MGTIDSRIDERGTLVSDNGQLLFRRKLGERLNVDGCPVTELALGHPGRLIATIVDVGIAAIERLTPEL